MKHKWTHLSMTNSLHANFTLTAVKHVQNTRKCFKHRHNSMVVGLLSSIIVYLILTDQDIRILPRGIQYKSSHPISLVSVLSDYHLGFSEPLQPTLHTLCPRLRHTLSVPQASCLSHISSRVPGG
jgi:hypothetical protein